jgi:hypothetical protein
LLSWQTPDAKKLANFFAVFVETLSGQAFRRRGGCNWLRSKYSAKIDGLDYPFIVARQARRVKAPRDPSLQSAASLSL